MTQLRLIRWPDLRLHGISSCRYLALGAAWLEALKVDRDGILRRWPNTDRLVLEDPLAGDELLDPVTTGAALVKLVAPTKTLERLEELLLEESPS